LCRLFKRWDFLEYERLNASKRARSRSLTSLKLANCFLGETWPPTYAGCSCLFPFPRSAVPRTSQALLSDYFSTCPFLELA
jgi:hypothetical protein